MRDLTSSELIQVYGAGSYTPKKGDHGGCGGSTSKSKDKDKSKCGDKSKDKNKTKDKKCP